MKDFLPVTAAEIQERGWDRPDFVFVSGDAYVDHPGFGPAIICRLLEAHGYRVGIIAQPDWRSTADFCRLGRPRLGFLVSAGNMDSLLNRFTAAKKRRSTDAYSPGGKADCRPPRAVIVYTARLREAYPGVPVIIGGIEASLRRFAHYDYWSDDFRRSVLADSAADILVYGMGERQILDIAAQLRQGVPVEAITDVAGTCYRVPGFDYIYDYVKLPAYDAIRRDKKIYAAAFREEYLEQDAIRGRRLAQENGEWIIVQNPPALPLSQAEMDEVYDLPYARACHPMYEAAGDVPALKEVEFSLVSHRGCFGGCNFCAIVSHQGRVIQARSHESLLKEAKILTKQPGFKGYIHDVGGPTANFRQPSCQEQLTRGTCRGKSCLSPSPCQNLTADHADYIRLLREIRSLPGIKKVFVRSGVRFDYLLAAQDDFLTELCEHHVSGHLKIAPEHISDRVTRLMGKSDGATYRRFIKKFAAVNKKLGKEQYLVPYFMSSHPGATLADAVELAEFIRDMGYRPQQVQDFIPTPGTLSTAMYCTGIDPLTGKAVPVARTSAEKKLQRALLQYWLPANRPLVEAALLKTHREDLIGYGPKCLIRPLRETAENGRPKKSPDKKPRPARSRKQRR